MDPSSSSSSYLSPPQSRTSRFSTIKVFGKFGSKNKEKGPPPVPPKDAPYYLNSNRSFVSIASQYARKPSAGSLHPSHSTMSLASSAMTADSDAIQSPPTSAKIKSKKSGFFGRKRSPGEDGSLKPTEDENISMPWNFQHNIHVNEVYEGMPPSWTVSLAEAGFTPEEIAAIYSRKQSGTLTPSSFSDSFRSPPILSNPHPRTSSLPRQYSNGSIRSATSSASPPPLPLNPLVGRKIQQQRSRNNSSSSSSLALSISLESASDTKMRPNILVEQGKDEIQTRHRSTATSSSQKTSPLSTSAPVSLNNNPPPSTPPRRAYYIANVDTTQSPPPAYEPGSSHSRHATIEKLDDRLEEDRTSGEGPEARASPGSAHSDANNIDNDGDDDEVDFHPVVPLIPLTPLALPDLDPGLGLGNLNFNFSDLGFTSLDITLDSSSSAKPSTSFSTSSTIPPVVIDNTAAKRTTITPSSITLSSVMNANSGDASSSLLAAPIVTPGPPASPTSPFPRTPSPPHSPMSSVSHSALGPEPEPTTASTESTDGYTPGRLIKEIQGMLAPGGMSDSSRESRYQKGKKGRDQDLTPIERLRGYKNLEGDEEDVNHDKAWGGEDKHLSSTGWNSPALSESQSPTLPPASPFGDRSSVDVIGGPADSGYSLNPRSVNEIRNSSRSSSSTVSTLSAVTVTQATRVTATTTVFQRAMATEVAIGRTDGNPKLLQGQGSGAPSASPSPPSSLQQPQQPLTVPPSPQSSTFGGSEEEDASASSSRMSGSTSTSASSSLSPSTDTQTEEEDTDLVYYLDSPLSPKMAFERNEAPTQHGIQTFHKQYHLLKSTSDTFGGSSRDDGEYEGAEYVEDEEATSEGEGGTLSPRSAGSLTSEPAPSRTSASVVHPTILVNSRTHVIPDGPFSAPIPSSSASSSFSSTSPISPGLRYHGWLSGVVKPLEEYIDEPVDPREYYLDLAEVAEGDNGPVYSARISEHANLARLTKLPPLIKARDVEGQANGEAMFVAIKTVPILPSGSTKLDEVRNELGLLRGVMHINILGMHALYVDLVEDSLWIRMELMERSLADVVTLCEHGLVLQERVIARFTNDTLEALRFLREHSIAHRDIRSDNLLLNNQGVLKLTDFSNAVKVLPTLPVVTDPVGILYWQAPEVRTGPYNALKVDVWSIGATVWELAQAVPPFADPLHPPGDRWPKLSKPEIFSPAFHDFLRMCSEPASSRPDAHDLLKNSFVNNTCGRAVVVQLLQQCLAIEKLVTQRQELEEEDESTLMSR